MKVKIKIRIIFWSLIFVLGFSQLFGQNSNKPVDDFLKSLKGNINPSICWYIGTNLKSTQSIASGFLKAGNSEWTCNLVTLPSKQTDALDVTATFILTDGSAASAAVAVSFNFNQWSTNNYILVPASVYNGNRYRSIGNAYNPDYPIDMYYNPDVPLTISNNPRLALKPGD